MDEASPSLSIGVSVTDERRPALEAILTSAEKGEIDVVVCTGLDRLVGTPEDLFKLTPVRDNEGIAS